MKKQKRFCALCLTALMLFMTATPIFAQSQEELEAELEASEAKQVETQVKIDTTKDTIADIESELFKADNEIGRLTGVISELDKELEVLQQEITKTEGELEAAQKKEKEQEEALKARIRTMYMYGNEGYLEVMFSAKDLTDLLSRIDIVKSVMKADRDYADELEATRKEIEAKKQKIEADKKATETNKARQQLVLAEEQTLRTQRQELIDTNQQMIDEYFAILDAEQEASEQLKTEIAGLLESIPGTVNPSTGWTWPIPGVYTITSWFGNRPYPGAGGSTDHGGIDIGADYETPIVAVGNGKVIMAQYYGGYGNCIILDMGNGYQTLYGHMSGYAVSAGDIVTQGQTIGYVGSTGNSTGPHLHIEVQSNGRKYDPLDFLPY